MSRSAMICRTGTKKNVQLAAFPVEMVNSSHVDGSDGLILNLISFHFDAQAERREQMESSKGMAKQWGAKGTMQT